jgi:hypothetical protein
MRLAVSCWVAAPLCLCIRRMVSKGQIMPTHEPSRETRRPVCCGVVGREVEGLQRVASPAQLNSIVCTRQFSPGMSSLGVGWC